MSKKQLFIIGCLVVFFVFVVTLGILNKNKPTEIGQNATGMNILKTSSTPVTYSKEVPKNATATIPMASAPAAPNTTAEYGVFKLSIDKDGFHPDSFTVKRGNVVRIEVTSVDGDYDMWIPHKEMYWAIKKGETKPFQFTALESGTALFKCRDFCPSGKIFQGTIITLEK